MDDISLVDPLMTFSVILVISLIIPEIFHRFKITHVPFYIVAGVLIGPFGLGIQAHEALRFLGEIGLFVLVFLAGLEIHESKGINVRHTLVFVMFMATISFIAGFILGILYSNTMATALLLGTILVSSSVGEIIPIVHTTDEIKKRFGNFIIPGVIILDATSLIMLGIILKYKTEPGQMTFFFIGIIVLLFFSFYILPGILKYLFIRESKKPREFDLKVVLAVLISIVALSEIIGLHGIVTAFIVGIVVGEYIPSEKVFEKIHGLGHGFLIPIFFIVLGMTLDITILFKSPTYLMLPLILISTLIFGKILGGLFYAYSKRLKLRDGVLLGSTLLPQLSATLAATAIGYEYGIFDSEILLAVVIMAMFSTITTPFIIRYITKEKKISMGAKEHTVVIGFGRTSAKVVTLLNYMNKDVVVIDKSINKIHIVEKRGIPAVYGDATLSETLRNANVSKAKVVLITLPDEHDTYICAKNVRKLNPGCKIIVKIHTERAYKRLQKEKLVDTYIWPEKLGSLKASENVLRYLSEEEFSLI